MIRPEDIFNAHRVVGSPSQRRPARPSPLNGISMPPVPDLGDPQRRATLARVVQRRVREISAPAVAAARQARRLRLR